MREGDYSFGSDVELGDSGSPIFNLQNKIIGVLKKEVSSNGSIANLGIYTGPFQIREMIETYRDFVNSGKL